MSKRAIFFSVSKEAAIWTYIEHAPCAAAVRTRLSKKAAEYNWRRKFRRIAEGLLCYERSFILKNGGGICAFRIRNHVSA